jgi:hypothetical protein
MFAVRTAILAIGLATSLSAPHRMSSAPATHPHVAAFRLDHRIVQSAVFRLVRTAKVTHFTPWKARPKIFLGEPANFPEETTSEPVLLLREVTLRSTPIVTTSRNPGLSPLRC